MWVMVKYVVVYWNRWCVYIPNFKDYAFPNWWRRCRWIEVHCSIMMLILRVNILESFWLPSKIKITIG